MVQFENSSERFGANAHLDVIGFSQGREYFINGSSKQDCLLERVTATEGLDHERHVYGQGQEGHATRS